MPGRTTGNYAVGRVGGPSSSGREGGTKDTAEDLFQLIIAYAKQETLDPVVKQLKALAQGIAGAALLALGTVFLSIGFVRALQAEFGSTQPSAASSFAVIRRAPANIGVFVNHQAYPYGSGTHLSGDWSWVPYMGGALFALLVAGFGVMRILKGPGR
jgi:hypothetical protein